ncbi:ninjurin-A isoform X2 [Leptinotarsa decemlineata]|uniref:ninjurin-A isoform X2 n=1 Tax=Leptinotarsa decemlineata TaxID=7539 RepID=UPI000C254A6A|nr:uncharacterized protein LOC111513551 isoform X2 [Leptinotarsa decemlineata]
MNVSYAPLNPQIANVGKLNGTDKANDYSSMVLLSESAPIAESELDDDLDDRQVSSQPFPGVDDGFFDNKDENPKTDVETIDPTHPDTPGVNGTNDPKETDDDWPSFIPSLTPRMGPDDGDDPDTSKDHPDGYIPHPPSDRPHFLTPGVGFDPEIGSTFGGADIPDVNIYQHKKTLAQGMMDLALFSANANQLRYVLESFSRHPYYYPSVILISLSLILQIGIGVGLIWNATYNVKDEKEICIANKINNFTIIGIFLVTVINVFISAFGVANPA